MIWVIVRKIFIYLYFFSVIFTPVHSYGWGWFSAGICGDLSLGDGRLEVNGDAHAGGNNDWDPDTYEDVLSTPENDTTYTSSNTTGHIQTYPLQNIPASATITSITVYVRVRDDFGTDNNFIRPVLYIAGSPNYGTAVTPQITTFTWQSHEFTNGSGWTGTQVNAAEAGIELQDSDGGHTVDMSGCYAIVAE